MGSSGTGLTSSVTIIIPLHNHCMEPPLNRVVF
jgi:hypothetical protein